MLDGFREVDRDFFALDARGGGMVAVRCLVFS